MLGGGVARELCQLAFESCPDIESAAAYLLAELAGSEPITQSPTSVCAPAEVYAVSTIELYCETSFLNKLEKLHIENYPRKRQTNRGGGEETRER